MSSIAAIATAIIAILSNLQFIIKYLDAALGPDWYKKGEQIQQAIIILQQAKTQEDKDAALQALAKAFNSIP